MHLDWHAKVTRTTMQHKPDVQHKQKHKCMQHRGTIDCVTNNHITLGHLLIYVLHICSENILLM